MTTSTNTNLQSTIKQAVKKVNGEKEFDICRYIPGDKGYYLHHLSYGRLKRQEPKTLQKLLKTHILESKQPKKFPSAPRSARDHTSVPKTLKLSAPELRKILDLVKGSGDADLANKLQPKMSLPQLKRLLIASIRGNEPDQNLWDALTQTLKARS